MTGLKSLPTAGSTYDPRLALLDAVRELHAEVSRLVLPLDVPGAAQMRRERESVLNLLDGYLVSRLHAGDRPLLAVIGGPTGAGKSTILNSLVGAPVSPASVLRPTTRIPVLLYNPMDEHALLSQSLLPGLEMTTLRDDHHQADHRNLTDLAGLTGPDDVTPLRRLRLVARQELPPGLAVLDSPDLDSWLSANRELAAELLGVADLWIFATTGTDYADAVPWQLLDAAVERRVTLAAVLNRMRPEEMVAVRRHFAQMLTERGLPGTPVFTIPELVLIDGRIPWDYVAQLNHWLAQQSGVDDVREAYLDRAMRGTLDQVLVSVRQLIGAAADQVVAERRLRVDLKAIFSHTREEVHAMIGAGGLTDGLRDPWRGVAQAAGAGGGRLRRRLNAALRPAESPYAAVGSALRTSIAVLVGQQVSLGLSRVSERWNAHPAAASVSAVELEGLPRDFAARADAAVVAWLDGIEERLGVRHERHPISSRWLPEAVAMASLTLALPSDDPDGPAAGAHRTLAERGAQPTATDVETALKDLLARLDGLTGEEEQRLAGVLDRAQISSASSSALRVHLESLERLKRTAFTPEADQLTDPD